MAVTGATGQRWSAGIIDNSTDQNKLEAVTASSEARGTPAKMHGLGHVQKSELGRRRDMLRRFWATGLGYWRRNGERSAWVLTAGLFAVVFLNLGVSY